MIESTRNGALTRRRYAGMAAALLTATAMVATLVSPAQAQQQRREAPLRVSYPTDGAMTCDQLTLEIDRIAEIAGIAAQNAENAESQGQMANAATSVALSGALYSGALGRVPGLGMFANAAGGMARRAAEARAREEAERVRVAEQRHTLLTGIYQGRQCGMPAAVPVAVAEAAPVAAPAVATVVQEAASALPTAVETTAPVATPTPTAD